MVSAAAVCAAQSPDVVSAGAKLPAGDRCELAVRNFDGAVSAAEVRQPSGVSTRETAVARGPPARVVAMTDELSLAARFSNVSQMPPSAL